MKKLLRWFLGIVLGVIVCLALFLGIVTAFAIPVELTRFKEPLENIVSSLLDRPVTIKGPIVVATSLHPSFTLKGLQIQNPENFTQKDFLVMEEVYVQLSIIPLITKKIHIPEFRVQGLTMILEENRQGDVNWAFGPGNGENTEDGDADQGTGVEVKSRPGTAQLANDTVVVEKLDLQAIKIAYYKPDSEVPARFLLSKCDGAMDVGQPMRLDITGEAGEFPYSVKVSVASLEELITENKTWLDMELNIAETAFQLSGNVDLATAARSLTLSASVRGDNLASLNSLLRIDLPPFTPYRLTSQLHLQKHIAELQKLQIETGVSSLNGNARIEKGDTITARVHLNAPLIQLDDFLFEDWSWTADEETTLDEDSAKSVKEKEVAADDESVESKENRKLIDPKILERFDCTLEVVADKVESGEDFLGSGKLTATLKDGRIDVEPLAVVLPGGGINMSASLKPGDENAEGSLKVLIENFDIGILVRRKQPDSDMGGLVNLNIDLSSSASSVAELMGAGSGYFDFSGTLTNFKSGIIDLWAVNLISAIVSSTKESQSQINCAVGRWSASDGQLTSDAFFIDTSKIRICAEGNINLKEERLKIEVAPRAKKAEFFSLATPVKLQGSFSDLNVKLGGGGVLGTAVKMVVSPVTTPLKRIFNDKIPRDGGDVCSMVLGPESREDISVPGCR